MISAIVLGVLTCIAAASGAIFKPGAWYDSLERPGLDPARLGVPGRLDDSVCHDCVVRVDHVGRDRA